MERISAHEQAELLRDLLTETGAQTLLDRQEGGQEILCGSEFAAVVRGLLRDLLIEAGTVAALDGQGSVHVGQRGPFAGVATDETRLSGPPRKF
jgi:hypothetical protein